MPLLWYRRLSVTAAQAELVKSDNALAWPETACRVLPYAHCNRSGNVLICYNRRQNSQVGASKSVLVICTRLPKGKRQVSGWSTAKTSRQIRSLSLASCFFMWDLRRFDFSLPSATWNINLSSSSELY